MNGILNILKPAGMTSHDVVNAVRRILKIRKVGHTGTLDPMAAGVLPVCVGSATRITEYLDADYKKYRCEMQLGIQTDTEDIWGNVLSRMAVAIETTETHEQCDKNENVMKRISEAAVIEAARRFVGDVMQKPPDYSAVRIAGRRLYEYARNGESVLVEPRRINVKALTVRNFRHAEARVMFDIESSKGSYIRTICSEIGNALGCGAAMSFLVRTACGRFELEHATSLEELERATMDGRLQDVMLPMDYPLTRFEAIQVINESRAQYFINGGPLDPFETIGNLPVDGSLFRLYSGGVFIAMARFDADTGKIKSDKVFHRGLNIKTEVRG